MAKKFGKFLMVTAALGAVAAGAYYYLKGKDALMDDDFDDDDDFDNFDEDLDDDSKETDRNYVDLDLQKADDFKEGINIAKVDAGEKIVGSVKEAAGKAEDGVKEAAGKAEDSVKEAADKVEEKVEEFFDDDDSDGSMDAM